jgi:hypothetical protein
VEKALTIEHASVADVLDLLNRAGTARADTTGGTASITELCSGPNALAFAVIADGQRVGAYCVKLVDHETARVAWVQAAGGHLPGADLTAEIIPAIEAQAAQAFGADQVAITTRRRALVAKLLGMGFQVTGITLRKNL